MAREVAAGPARGTLRVGDRGSSPPGASSPSTLAAGLASIAIEAGALILRCRARDLAARPKADGSPVTTADLGADALIRERLARLAPGVPVVSEESNPVPPAGSGEPFFCVDPLDGTRDFLAGSSDFTVNIALVERGRPVLGVVAAPAYRRVWCGERGAGAALAADCAPDAARPLAWGAVACRALGPPESLVALVSSRHGDGDTDAFLARLGVGERRTVGSSLKFCRIAEGAADLYPRFGPTMAWDTAAGQAVLEAAGGCVLDVGGAPLSVRRAGGILANPGFVAWGRGDGEHIAALLALGRG